MGLADDLKALGSSLPPSHQVTVADLIPVVSGLLAYQEHGYELLAALNEDPENGLHRILGGENYAPPAAPPPTPAEDQATTELAAAQARIAELEAAQAANIQQATSATTTVQVTPLEAVA